MVNEFTRRLDNPVSDIPAYSPPIPTLSCAKKFIGGDTLYCNGASWPPPSLAPLRWYQNFCMSLYTGDYAYNRKWIAFVDNVEREMPYCMLTLNYFKKVADTVVSLAFGNEIMISTGDKELDKQVKALADRLKFEIYIQKALLYSEIYGDAIIRVNKDGINVLPPLWGIKNVNQHNIDSTDSITLYDYLYDEDGSLYGVYLETHYCDRVYRCIREYSGSSLGDQIAGRYQGSYIPQRGCWDRYPEFDGGSAAIWCSLNQGSSVYGTSAFNQIKDVVFAIESVFSLRNYITSENAQPFLIMGMSMFTTNEETGGYELKKINDRYLIKDSDGDPTYLEWGGENLQRAAELSEDLMQAFYELSEISKSVISGEYSGQVTMETLQTTAKSTIDRAQRDVTSLWYQFREALFIAARLNGIDIDRDQLTLSFNVDRALTDMELAQVAETLIASGVMSRETILQKYYGLTQEQARNEVNKVKGEDQSSNPESYSE